VVTRLLGLLLGAVMLVAGVESPVQAAPEQQPSATEAPRARKKVKKQKAAPLPKVVFMNINSREKATLIPVDRRGRARVEAMRRIGRLLRDRKARRQRKIHPRLLRMIAEVGAHYAPRRVELVSGFRHSKDRKSKSPHAKAVACDFRVSGVSNQALRDYLRSKYAKIGVGYYPNSVFVHLDVRAKQSAFWIDYAGPGDPAEYSGDPEVDLATGEGEGEPIGLPSGAESETASAPKDAPGDARDSKGGGDAKNAKDAPAKPEGEAKTSAPAPAPAPAAPPPAAPSAPAAPAPQGAQ
jgi:uncharacterized protein YcbK (DUF882 family)